MQSQIIKVVAIAVDTRNVTLFSEDGESYQFKQGHRSIEHITTDLIPVVRAKGNVEVDIASLQNTTPEETYSAYESQSKLVRFFSVAKDKMAKWFESEPKPITPELVGSIPALDTVTESDAVPEVKEPNPDEELLEGAHPTGTPEFTKTASLEDKETVLVGIINGKVVPDVQGIKNHINHANVSKSTKAMDMFLARVAATADTRKHSAKDLMTFMSTADLPISDNGMIIAYKNLNCIDADTVTKFTDISGGVLDQVKPYINTLVAVDIHSGTIPQGVGTVVSMASDKVNSSRRVSCSNGLHIASRSYLSSFSGHITVACYIDPADVVAVPEYETSKMRVSRYHIVEQLSPELSKLVCNSSAPLTSTADGRDLLARLVKGEYPRPILNVHQDVHGSGVIKLAYQPTASSKQDEKKEEETTTGGKPISVEEATKSATTSEYVNPNKVESSKPKAKPKRAKKKPVKKATKPKATPTKSKVSVVADKKLTRKQMLHNLLSEGVNVSEKNAKEAMVIKKAMKKGWAALGVSDAIVAAILKHCS